MGRQAIGSNGARAFSRKGVRSVWRDADAPRFAGSARGGSRVVPVYPQKGLGTSVGLWGVQGCASHVQVSHRALLGALGRHRWRAGRAKSTREGKGMVGMCVRWRVQVGQPGDERDQNSGHGTTRTGRGVGRSAGYGRGERRWIRERIWSERRKDGTRRTNCTAMERDGATSGVPWRDAVSGLPWHGESNSRVEQ